MAICGYTLVSDTSTFKVSLVKPRWWLHPYWWCHSHVLTTISSTNVDHRFRCFQSHSDTPSFPLVIGQRPNFPGGHRGTLPYLIRFNFSMVKPYFDIYIGSYPPVRRANNSPGLPPIPMDYPTFPMNMIGNGCFVGIPLKETQSTTTVANSIKQLILDPAPASAWCWALGSTAMFCFLNMSWKEDNYL